MEEFEDYYLKKNPHIVFLPSKKNTLVVKLCLHMNIPFYLIAPQRNFKPENMFNYFELIGLSSLRKLKL